MKNKLIGLIGAEDDSIIRHLSLLIESQGNRVVFINSEEYPQKTTLSMASWMQSANGYNLAEVNNWIVRSIYLSLPVFELPDGEYGVFQDWRAQYLAARESYALIVSWLKWLEFNGKRILNPLSSFDLHFLKPFHIEHLRAKGFPVPQSLCSNDSAQVRNFIESFDRIIYKPIAGGAYCQEIDKNNLNSQKLETLRNSPVIFQELIEGDNIRVTVVGDKVISSALIETEALDYRGNEKSLKSIELPTWIKEMCVQACKESGMLYSGIDLIQNSAGYTLLECNPAPMYLGIEKNLGHNISEAILNFISN